MMRFEYKYLAPISGLEAMRRRIEPFVYLDKYAAKRQDKEYVVRSIYFDNAHLQYYDDKIEGYKIRKKLRIRGYDDPDGDSRVFLEIKRKLENYIDKVRASVRFDNLNDLFATRDFQRYLVKNSDDPRVVEGAQRFFFNVYREGLKPVILVTYDREAFHYRFNPSLRLTFDKHLRFRHFPSFENLFDENDLSFPLKEHFILEIKFNKGVPFWVKELIKDFRLGRYALSKYAICMDADKRVTPLEKRVSFIMNRIPELRDLRMSERIRQLKQERNLLDVQRL